MPWRQVVNDMPTSTFTLDDFLRQGAEVGLQIEPDDAESLMLGLEELGLLERIEGPVGSPPRWVRRATYAQA